MSGLGHRDFIFRFQLALLFGGMLIFISPLRAFEIDGVQEKIVREEPSGLEVLFEWAQDFEAVFETTLKESPVRALSAVQDPSSVANKKNNEPLARLTEQVQEMGQYGNLPLPLAQLSELEFSKKDLQNQKVGEMGGSPYGALSGKSTFGKNGADTSFQNLLENRGLNGTPETGGGNFNFIDSENPLTQEQMLEAQTQIAQLQNEMDKLTLKAEPYQETDYKAYESAKELFRKNEKIITRLKEFEEGFVRNAKELFVNFSWRDMDKVGKRPYENFIDKQESKGGFPYPKGQEPKPTIHQGGRSH